MRDTLLLIGDGASDRAELRGIFEASYHLLEAENIAQAVMLLRQNCSCIAAVLADVPRSRWEDLQTLTEGDRAVRENIPLIVFIPSADAGEQAEYAYLMGATDVVKRPYTPTSVLRRVQILVELYHSKQQLEQVVEEQNETIRHSNQVMVDALSTIIEHRSTESGNHVLRIRRFTRILLQEVARSCPEYGLTGPLIDTIASASALHDIGKISVPDAILNKPGKLTEEEFEVMKRHTTIGSQLVEQLQGIGDEQYLRYAYNIALYHHERWDGNGYPCGLKGDEIPICAQVVGVADVFDALTTTRVYKEAFSCARALTMILNGECGVFAPRLLECLKRVKTEFTELARQYADGYSPKSDNIRAPLKEYGIGDLSIDATQMAQMKYQALLHYANNTVMELDVGQKVYHVIYNPDPDLEALVSNASFDEMADWLVRDGMHPEGIDSVQELRRIFSEDLFQKHIRRRSFCCQIFSHSRGVYQPYEVTVLRLDTGNPQQLYLLAVFRKTEEPQPAEAQQEPSLRQPLLQNLLDGALRCCGDDALTIQAGTKSLYYLTGYTEEEVDRIFDRSLLKLVYPQDRESLLAGLWNPVWSRGRVETECRLLRKDGAPVWVMVRACGDTGADGREALCLILTDISGGREKMDRLETALRNDRIVIEQSGGIMVDWDLTTDTAVCSDKWEQRFGYPPLSANFSKQLATATHFHPDDLPLLRAEVRALRESHGQKTTADIDVRIADRQGKYLWNKLRATAIQDENGRPVRVVAFITDIHELKQAAISMKERADRDGLTKLFNKMSGQRLVRDYLATRGTHEVAALLILDLDNFKTVNDTYGHMYGDAVLTQAAMTLQKMFRSQDIISRIGGDEFMVLVKAVPDAHILQTRCELLVEAFREMFGKLMPDLDVSCSIGVAMCPDHGVGYTELFRHADMALYRSKQKGKNQYKIYDPQDSIGEMELPIHASPEEAEEHTTLTDESFARFAFRRLCESRNLAATIDELLAIIGAYFDVSRVYIFEDSADGATCSNTFEWCNAGVSPEQANLQGLSYQTDLPGWKELYNENGVFYCTDITVLSPPIRAVLEPQDIKSMLQCSIMDGGVFRGFVGFDECTSNRLWTQEQISLLAFLSEILGVFLLKLRNQQRGEAGPDRAIPAAPGER
jgi:putative two-component system response regulator